MIEGQHPRHQLVEHHAQAVDVGAGVDVEPTRLGLLRAHVGRRADGDAELGGEGRVGQPLLGRLGDPEVDDGGDRLPVGHPDQDVAGLEVAVDDALLVGVLDPAADAEEELEPVTQIEVVPVAVGGDRLAGHELHDEVGEPLVGGAGVERAGDVGVIHDREGLPLALEAGEHLIGIHAEPDHLERDGAAEGLQLLGFVDGSHAALAEDAGDAVGADAVGVGGAP